MMSLQYRPIPGMWLTIRTDIPEDRWASIWADWCWKTSAPIRLVDSDGLAVREYHPTKRK